MTYTQIVSFIWGVADLIRDTFKRGKYQDVILPLTVLRRLDCVLAPTKQNVLERQAELRDRGLQDLSSQLCVASGFEFYNTSQYDFQRLVDDAPNVAPNLRNYIAGFSTNMREVLERFDFDNTISRLDESGLLFQVLERFKSVDLHPDKVDNSTMGTIFEELIRRFNEALNENPGEHFTPRDVVHLMVDLMLSGDEEHIGDRGAVRTVYDPCCGSGGMLTIAKEHINFGRRENGSILHGPVNAAAEIHLYGQEVNPETWAVSKSDLFMKDPTGRDADNISFGSTLSNDRHAGQTFDYLIANPPYGKDWKRDVNSVRAEHELGAAGRFAPGLPRISDGQLLFLLHMLARAKTPSQGGSRIAIIMNGSPLFTGDAGSGESEIRRFIFENDLLEALIALPEQLFYNTGIATYVWLLTNRKDPERSGKVQLIDASSFWSPMPRSLGDKRRQIPPHKADDILKLLADYRDGDTRTVEMDGRKEDTVVSRIFPTSRFGFRKITVERPLRLNFRASPERAAQLDEQRGFQALARSRKRGYAAAQEEAQGLQLQERLRDLVNALPNDTVTDRAIFQNILAAAAKEAGVKLPAPARKAVLDALSERDETAEVCFRPNGSREPDPELRDTERVPLDQSVDAFFEREVLPHVPDAWIDESRRDTRDGQVGIVGYEVNFNRHFYRYTPPRPLDEIEADIREIEADIIRMLGEARTASPSE
ncbi:MAG: class I SAM-dependent DNA methyltransferase [Chloroflexi bacterium]|nr:class I SAM-dependent DNA methyltransferase [Chloroflexota bacterium]MCY3937421.1 class I SAM-dependent DNA methyltransferase [Chloroflexota bacterium]